MKNAREIEKALQARKTYSAWDRAVITYALELLADLADDEGITEKRLLNGADSWHEYSWGGCSLIYAGDIAERVCTPSELKKTRNGERRPNSIEDWLDVQARALYQACNIILHI